MERAVHTGHILSDALGRVPVYHRFMDELGDARMDGADSALSIAKTEAISVVDRRRVGRVCGHCIGNSIFCWHERSLDCFTYRSLGRRAVIEPEASGYQTTGPVPDRHGQVHQG